MKHLVFGLLLFLSVIFAHHSLRSANGEKVQYQGEWSVRMAESVMKRHPGFYDKWDYVTGTVLRGFEELWQQTGDPRYVQYIKSTVDHAVDSSGNIQDYDSSEFNLDEIKEGNAVLLLYRETGEEKYQKAVRLLDHQLENQPCTSEGGFWHKKKYPWQMWLDGLYMGSPFYAEYGQLFNEPQNFDDVVKQLTLMESHARDVKTGLLYHGWDEKKVQDWADPEMGCSPCFWGRAMGWYAMALVDVLDFLPADHAGRDSVIAVFQRLAEAVREYQDDSTGVWWQVMDQKNRKGNYLEASCSCMFVYVLAKGVRKGYIDQAYGETVMRGFRGILKEFVEEKSDGTIDLTHICQSAGLGYGRDGSYDYYVFQTHIQTNDGKGVGPFILACVEMERGSKAMRESSNEP